MSGSEASLFDVLSGAESPFRGFGEPTIVDSHLPPEYEQQVELSKKSVEEGFIHCRNSEDVIAAIEKTVTEMWEEGWNPREANIDLFILHFGTLVFETLRKELGALVVFRSQTDLLHASLWWQEKAIEAFPYHKTCKRLLHKEGESLTCFETGLRSLLQVHPQCQ